MANDFHSRAIKFGDFDQLLTEYYIHCLLYLVHRAVKTDIKKLEEKIKLNFI